MTKDFWSGSLDVRCPWHEGPPPFLVYPDVLEKRTGGGGVQEFLAKCPTCATTAWIRPDARDGRPFAAVIMPNREIVVRAS